MKTPMQELIEHLDDIKDVGKHFDFLGERTVKLVKSTIISIQDVIKDEYIEKEKQVIIDAHIYGQIHGNHRPEKYYEDKFKN